VIEPVWLHAKEETPPLLTDAAFASFVELGRRGTGHFVTAKRVELKRSTEATRFHKAYFKGPITFGARWILKHLLAGSRLPMGHGPIRAIVEDSVDMWGCESEFQDDRT